MAPSPDTPEVCEISDISSPHMDETEEYILISYIEDKYCCTSMQTFTGDFPLNYVQNLPVIASESEGKFDFSPSNVAYHVKVKKLIFWKKYNILIVTHFLPMI